VRIKLISFLFFIMMILSACQGSAKTDQTGESLGKTVSTKGDEYLDISVDDLETMLENKDFLMVNVHIPFEGDIPKTDMSIPYDEIEQHLDQLPSDKNAPIVLYCRSGRMSAIAAETLVGLGYTNIMNLVGGFNAWQNAGLPMKGE